MSPRTSSSGLRQGDGAAHDCAIVDHDTMTSDAASEDVPETEPFVAPRGGPTSSSLSLSSSAATLCNSVEPRRSLGHMTSDNTSSKTLSASVNLNDIISTYDSLSRISRSIASVASFFNLSSVSAYISATSGSTGLFASAATRLSSSSSSAAAAATQQLNNNNAECNSLDDTTSFYTAVPDSFSIDEVNTDTAWSKHHARSHPAALSEQVFHWTTSQNHSERDKMLHPKSDFTVVWSNVTYQIIPKFSLTSTFNNVIQSSSALLKPAQRVMTCGRWQQTYHCERMQCAEAAAVDNQGKKCCAAAATATTNEAYDVQYSNTQATTILRGISGSFKSGELTAVVGPSGAGKTSLLNFLARRREDGYTGRLYVDQTSSRRIKISTIPQNDTLSEYLTVRENLIYASRINNTHPHHDHKRSIAQVSNLLGLDGCLDTRTKKISGGEQKRLAIAQELLTKPDILILDEPTSGLDASTCYKTLAVLQRLVKASAKKLIDPIAIVLTIHQPEQEVFDLFDRVYVLANGGRAIYDGPPDKSLEFVEKYARLKPSDPDCNPASFLIEIASSEFGSEPIRLLEQQVRSTTADEQQRRRQSSCESLRFESLDIAEPPSSQGAANNRLARNSPLRRSPPDTTNFANGNGSNDKQMPLLIDHRLARGSSMKSTHFFTKTRILTSRCWVSILRDPKQLVARIVFHIIFPISLALIMGPEPGRVSGCPNYKPEYRLKELIEGESLVSASVQDNLLLSLENVGGMYMLIYALCSSTIGSATLTFTLDIQPALKEFYNGWYSMNSYLIARFMADLPLMFMLPMLSIAIGYPMTGQYAGHGLSDVYRALLVSLGVVLASMIGTVMGMIFGAIYVGHVTTALFMSQGSTLPLVFLSGFIVPTKNMSKLIYALSFMSFHRHTLEAAFVARYGFGACECDPKTISGKPVSIVGIPDKLKSFTDLYMSQMSDDNLIEANKTGVQKEDGDVFELFAKQISLFNTNGFEITSCDDVEPLLLKDLRLNNSHLPYALSYLIINLLVCIILLFITVRLIIKFKTSL